MTAAEDAGYRMRLARQQLDRARQQLAYGLWDATGLYAQLSTENSAKAVLSLICASVKSHDLRGDLLDARVKIHDKERLQYLERLAELTERMGMKEHILTTYGDEVAMKTPAEIYDEQKARNALSIAEEAARLAAALTGL